MVDSGPDTAVDLFLTELMANKERFFAQRQNRDRESSPPTETTTRNDGLVPEGTNIGSNIYEVLSHHIATEKDPFREIDAELAGNG